MATQTYAYGAVKPTDPSAPKVEEADLESYKSYVDKAFGDMLGRAPGEIGYDYWTKDLRAGQAHYAATEGLSDKDAFQKSLGDFYGNLARHSPDKTFSHDANTLGYKDMKEEDRTFSGEFAKENPNIQDTTGSNSPYANVINTGFDRLHGRTAGAIGMEYWSDDIKSNVAGGMSENEAIAQFYKNVALNPEAKSNLIDGEGPNVQTKALSDQKKMMYGGGGNTTINLQLGDLKSQTAADQMKIMPNDPMVNQASGRDQFN